MYQCLEISVRSTRTDKSLFLLLYLNLIYLAFVLLEDRGKVEEGERKGIYSTIELNSYPPPHITTDYLMGK